MLSTLLLCSLRIRRCSPGSTFHKRMTPPSLPLASVFPSGLNDTLVTPELWLLRTLCLVKVHKCAPETTSRKWMKPSLPPLASILPSGLNDTLVILPLCLMKVCIRSPDSAFNRLTTSSLPPFSPPIARIFPSGLYTIVLPERVVSLRMCVPDATSHRRTLCLLTPAIVLPSGLNDMLLSGTVFPTRRCSSFPFWAS